MPPFSIAPPDEEETASALPMSPVGGGQQGGDQQGDGQQGTPPDPPEAPSAPSYPRIDTDERERPTADQDARNRQALTGLLGALGTAFADAGDDPTMLNIASGLTQGASGQIRQRREELKQRQEAYNEFLTEAQRFNRKMQQRETQADFERRLSEFEARSDARQGALDRRADRRQARQEQRADRRADERDQEQALQRIRERGQQRRRTQRIENEDDGGGDTSEPIRMDDLSVPNDPAEAERRLNMVETRLQQMRGNRGRFTYEERNDRGVLEERTDEEYRERLSRLEQYRELLRNQVQSARGGAASQGGQPQPGQPQAQSARPAAAQPNRPQPNRPQPEATPTPDTSRQAAPQNGRQGSPQRAQQGGSYVDELNSALRSQGRRAALTKIADDLEAGRITERQAAAYYQQVAPDSLLNQ
jgi:hypothetical protein